MNFIQDTTVHIKKKKTVN